MPVLDPDAAAILEARHGDPFAWLGMHAEGRALRVRVFLPWARRLWVVRRDGGAAAAELARAHPDGLFAGTVGEGPPFPYRLRAEGGEGTVEFDDIYSFPPVLGDVDVYLLGEGNHRRAGEVMGAHCRTLEGVAGVSFAVWAPNARRVSAVGEFNDWDGRRCPMRLRQGTGVWEIFVPGLAPGAHYKYEIVGAGGTLQPLKADPVGAWAERSPGTASRIAPPSRHEWRDRAFLDARAGANDSGSPIAIYECHLGSWRRKPEEGDRMLTYRELADELVPYVRDMGFTHIELLPVSEHPFDGSWGYQPLGLFAPTSRFGTPDDFRAFMERCHEAGLGVFLDWVPGHFPTDPHGLARFDGTALYEHSDPRQGFQSDWNTYVYNFGRREVANFLSASALHWITEFHADGLRVDAVASMLYLDYSRPPGGWIPNIHGGRENLEAIGFLRRTNEELFGLDVGATTAAEESTAWPLVSQPVANGGLGFGYKWNMGWMHDTLRYMSLDPIYRKSHHGDLTFGLLYAFDENFILPLSHDEVVHGKGALVAKMPGDRWQRFANLRAYFAFMWTHPGKKLLFMGGEFAQEREWNHDRSLDWHLLGDPLHQGTQNLVRDLNRLYRALPALHALDCDPAGFQWLEANDADSSVLAYLRRGREPHELAAVVCNFTPVPRRDYRLGVPRPGRWRERFNSDASAYGGSGLGNLGGVEAVPIAAHGQPASLSLLLPPLATLIFTWEPDG